jgi:hypothetical protein
MQVQVNVSDVALYFTIMMYVIMYYHVVRNQDSHFMIYRIAHQYGEFTK